MPDVNPKRSTRLDAKSLILHSLRLVISSAVRSCSAIESTLLSLDLGCGNGDGLTALN